MPREEGAGGAPHHYSDEELAWMRGHLTELRHYVSGQRIMLESLGIGFVLGLAIYVAGYALKASATTEPFKLVGDLLYALGWALFTGVVVTLFVEIIPRAKQRQISKALDSYEAALHEKLRSGSTPTEKSDA